MTGRYSRFGFINHGVWANCFYLKVNCQEVKKNEVYSAWWIGTLLLCNRALYPCCFLFGGGRRMSCPVCGWDLTSLSFPPVCFFCWRKAGEEEWRKVWPSTNVMTIKSWGTSERSFHGRLIGKRYVSLVKCIHWWKKNEVCLLYEWYSLSWVVLHDLWSRLRLHSLGSGHDLPI